MYLDNDLLVKVSNRMKIGVCVGWDCVKLWVYGGNREGIYCDYIYR